MQGKVKLNQDKNKEQPSSKPHYDPIPADLVHEPVKHTSRSSVRVFR